MIRIIKHLLVVFVLLVVLCCGSSLAEELQPVILEVENLTFNISISRTANLFHIVDQLSEWSQFCHKQYKKDFINHNGSFSAEDQNMLEKHTSIRSVLRWGQGLEQTFYTTADLEAAVEEGIRNKYITPEQAETEIEVFEHFAPYVDKLIESERPNLDRFIENLSNRKAQLEDISKKLSIFCDNVKLEVPFFIIANPSDSFIGGGYNGQRLTLEIPRKRVSFNSLLHELMHAFIRSQREELENTVKITEGLDYMTLNEGIAYAFSPGIYHSGSKQQDPLFDHVKADIKQEKSLLNDYSTSVYRYGLALRPLLIDAFEKKQSIKVFLPRARDAWLIINELDSTAKTRGKCKGWFSHGPGWETLGKIKNSRVVDIFYSSNHTEEGYKRTFDRALPGSTIILCFALDHWDKNIPERYHYLLPKPWKEIESLLKEGQVLELSHECDGFKVVLLGAPNVQKLQELIVKTELLKVK
jgi:hypothetical protein